LDAESQPIILASNLQKNGPDAVEGLAQGTQDELSMQCTCTRNCLWDKSI